LTFLSFKYDVAIVGILTSYPEHSILAGLELQLFVAAELAQQKLNPTITAYLLPYITEERYNYSIKEIYLFHKFLET